MEQTVANAAPEGVAVDSAGASGDPLESSFAAMLKTDEHGERIDALEGAVDGVKADVDALKGETATLKTGMARIASAAARPVLASPAAPSGAEVKGGATSPALRAFVDGYLRAGRETEIKSFNAGSGPEGGFAVPDELDAVIAKTLNTISPIRRIANVVQTGSAGYRKLITHGGTPSGWVSETAARDETDTPTFAEIAPPSGELYANPAASQTMLDDAAFNVEQWLASEIAEEFARAEGAAFIKGSGANQPRGFLRAPVSDAGDATRAFGTLQTVFSGADAGFAASDPEDRLIDLVHSLKPAYRQGASFVMNSTTLALIRKFKTEDGAFLWQPGLAEGRPDTLLGYPVVEAEDMPDIASGSLSIAFGNFRAGYLIAERKATTILRDPFTNKPFVHFYATKRVGGQVLNSEAIKLMRFGAIN
ncbi:phage major capsid protein [Alterisphingorhabdus coralli]|uniref:Phage major capsid protein n=1 Tax=Alterisphingorhabdus coralli TaxID=3071408 RepID=A0AA97I1T6_9SPHN|nr:phage major capsid protein [Parasphingorhabdus sp. SCSIO 66989]WOE75678.1 phage major capsid protein [Parasphingorhabdus sp. SCSIO 66989]